MTNGHNFKVGDYVRVKDSSRTGDIVDIDVCMDWQEYNHTIYTIRGSYPDREPFCFYEFEENLEPTKIGESQTAFLTRLQSLLSQYDASIGYFIGDDEKYGWSDYPFLKIGKEIIKYPAGEIDEITADNIMDFDRGG